MRFESVTAHAFGPFRGQSLSLAPGMNVVWGPNEAGKSSWHAALHAGLCGLRRGKGGPRKDEREFADRHRPWDGGGWEVGVLIALADDRRIELRHDLEGRVACRATDADLGRDCSSEIMHEGAPDGARWLGLDRSSFPKVACVRQADVVLVQQDADLLREHIQRAATAASADATAAAALDRLEAFRAARVGSVRSNARKPLRTALNRVEAARQALEQSKWDHEEYLALAERLQRLEDEAKQAEQRFRAARSVVAEREARALADRLERARRLAAQFPDGEPPSAAAESDLDRQVAAALRAWADRPDEPVLEGETAAELAARLAALPQPPVGDLEPPPSVQRTAETCREARSALERHRADRPEAPPQPRTGGATERELRELAERLAEAEPPLDPALVQRWERAKARFEAARQSRPPALGLVAGLALLAAGLAAVALGQVAPGAALLALGGGLAAWTFLQRNDREQLAAMEALRQVEQALGAQQYAVSQASQRRETARQRAADLGLPADPAALEALARAVEQSATAQREQARWQEREQALAREAAEAATALIEALRQRGEDVAGDALVALARYEAACRQRAEIARQAAQREAAEARLAARRHLEAQATETARRRAEAAEELRQVAALCGVSGEAEAALAAALAEWQRRVQAEQREREAAQRAWADYQGVLGGRTLDELAARVAEQQAAAERLAGEVTPEALASARESESPADLDGLAAAAAEATRQMEQARGQLEERTRTLRSVAEAEEELAAAEAELARVQALDRTLQRTAEFLERAQERVHRDIAPVLATSVRQRLAAVTAGRYQEVRVDPETLEVYVSAAGGQLRRAHLLSHGTTEQIYLLLRVALAERLTKQGEVCPLVLDDVTAQSDSQRTAAILQTLHALSQERQVILFSQEAEVLAWAEAHLGSARDRLLRLDPAGVPA